MALSRWVHPSFLQLTKTAAVPTTEQHKFVPRWAELAASAARCWDDNKRETDEGWVSTSTPQQSPDDGRVRGTEQDLGDGQLPGSCPFKGKLYEAQSHAALIKHRGPREDCETPS
eukprot:jgi/Ulvmu1/1986/UM012_0148.1